MVQTDEINHLLEYLSEFTKLLPLFNYKLIENTPRPVEQYLISDLLIVS